MPTELDSGVEALGHVSLCRFLSTLSQMKEKMRAGAHRERALPTTWDCCARGTLDLDVDARSNRARKSPASWAQEPGQAAPAAHAVQAIVISHGVHQAAHTQLGLGVAPTHARHPLTPLACTERVHVVAPQHLMLAELVSADRVRDRILHARRDLVDRGPAGIFTHPSVMSNRRHERTDLSEARAGALAPGPAHFMTAPLIRP